MIKKKQAALLSLAIPCRAFLGQGEAGLFQCEDVVWFQRHNRKFKPCHG
jgi:hypothetical protein